MTGLTRRVVHATMAALVATGWLTVIETSRKGNYGTLIREFTAVIPASWNGALPAPMDHHGNRADTAPLENRVDGANRHAATVHNDAVIGANGVSNGAVITPEAVRNQNVTGARGKQHALDNAALSETRRKEAQHIAPGFDAAAEWVKFLDHQRANGKQPADLDAAWRNWLRRCPQFASRRAAQGMTDVGTIRAQEDAEWQRVVADAERAGFRKRLGHETIGGYRTQLMHFQTERH